MIRQEEIHSSASSLGTPVVNTYVTRQSHGSNSVCLGVQMWSTRPAEYQTKNQNEEESYLSDYEFYNAR